jgi:glycosyltransferase involved in cell wall biosynthesis
LSLNEEANIERVLKQFRPLVAFELVLDGGSTDRTVELAKTIADKVEYHAFSGSFATEKNYARTLVPKECSWILWTDADEIWDEGFLRNLQGRLEQANKDHVACFRFARINLPGGINYPDYQARLFLNSRDILWKGDFHEIPYLIKENIPLDHADEEMRQTKLGVCTINEYPIIHLRRRTDLSRIWWKT